MHTEDVFLIEDISVFGVINNPFRQRLMRVFGEPRSVKAAAEALNVPVTRLYHHINQLADAGIVRVVEERKAGAMIEKIYQTTAKSFSPGPGLLTDDTDPDEMARVAAGIVLDPARADAEAALARSFRDQEAPAFAAIGRGQALMTPHRAEKFAKRVMDLLHELEEDDSDEDAAEFALSLAFFPIAVS